MQSPLTNFVLRPRSTPHRHRRTSSSASSLLVLDSSPLHVDNSLGGLSPVSAQAGALRHEAHPPSSGSDDDGIPCSAEHRASFESPFPSPFSLNVPLATEAAYLCTLTLSNNACSLSLCGDLLYTGLGTGDIVVFKTPRLPECARFGIGSLPIRAISVTDDMIFSAHKDHKIRIWQRPSAEGTHYHLVRTLPTTTDYLRNLLLSNRYIQIRRHHKQLWIRHVDTITAIAVDSTSLLLYTASWDRTFKIWNLRNLRCVQSVRAHDDAINAITLSSQPEGLIYTASSDGTIKVWKKLTAQKVVLATTLTGHTASVNALLTMSKFNPGVLYSGGSDCCINVWERVSSNKLVWKLAASLKGHRQPVLCLASAGRLVCSGGADRMIRVWRREGVAGSSFTCLAILQGHRGPVKSVAMAISSLRSCYVYSASLDGTTKVWSVLYDRDDHEDDLSSR